jgi:hypothetical protein
VPIKLEMKGLRELLAAMRKVAPEAKREFQNELKTIGKMVAADAAADMPRQRGKARRSVKVKVVARRGFEGVQISEGGAVAPYTPWLDFGGTVGRGRRSTARVTFHGRGRVTVQRGGSRGSGSVVRPYIKDGRYLYPAYFRRYDDMVTATLDAVHRAATAAGLEVASR